MRRKRYIYSGNLSFPRRRPLDPAMDRRNPEPFFTRVGAFEEIEVT